MPFGPAPAGIRATSRARRSPIWLSLALLACGASAKSNSSNDGGETSDTGGNAGSGGASGSAGTPAGGSAGVGTGGIAGSSVSVPAALTLNHAERIGTSVVLYFDNVAGAYEFTCVAGSSLVKASGESWRDERPPHCGGQAYYFDGTYVENAWSLGCLGCDVVSCVPFAQSISFRATDLLQTGVRSPPGGAGGAGSAGGGAGASLVPVIESVVDPGPYLLYVRYYTDSSCTGPVRELPPLPIALPVFDDGDGGAAGE